jgi:hypothetical protein
MPNYCSNNVTFTGKKEDIETLYQRFQKYNECDYFTHFCEMVLGIPKKDEVTNDNFFTYGYSYGTKWWDFEVRLDRDELIVSGDSAWSPPLPFIAKITEVFDVEAHGDYYETGMDFAGDYSAHDGVLDDNEMTCFEFDLMQDREYAIQKLIEDINDEMHDFEYVKDEFKKHFTEDEWNQVLTETKKK